MKKVLVIVAMLLAVSPVMATVTITASNSGTFTSVDANGNWRAVTVTVGYTSDVNVRAFALDINVDSGCTIGKIRGFKVGENNGTNNGYGIFPGRFRQYVNAASPDWGDGNANSAYNPTPYYNDPGSSGTGLDTNAIIVEMGYLGAGDSNMPAKTGTLFLVDVNGYGFQGTAHLTFAADAMRGGVVSKDTNATWTDTNLPFTDGVVFPAVCVNILNQVGIVKAGAEANWVAQGFTLGTATGDVNCAKVGLILSQDTTGCQFLPKTVNYHYATQATCPNIVGLSKSAAEAAITNAGLTVGTETGVFSDVTPVNQVKVQSPASGTLTCSAVTLSYVCRTVHCLSPYCKGDVNRDKFVRSSDVTALTNLVSSYPSPTYRASNTTCQYDPCADINGDNFVRASDITALVNQISAYPSPTYRCSCGAAACLYYSGTLTP